MSRRNKKAVSKRDFKYAIIPEGTPKQLRETVHLSVGILGIIPFLRFSMGSTVAWVMTRSIPEKLFIALVVLLAIVLLPAPCTMMGLILTLVSIFERSAYQKHLLIASAVLCIVPSWLVYSRSSIAIPGKTKPSVQVLSTQSETESRTQLESSVQRIFNRVHNSYGYQPQISNWGRGTGLFLPDAAWDRMDRGDRSILVEYMRSYGIWGIVVGRIKDTDTIYLDREVANWQSI
jgi:hypothetical protein